MAKLVVELCSMSSCDETRSQGKDLISTSRRGAEISALQMRAYVGDMSRELALMARVQGDEKLALLLEVAADMACNKVLSATG